MRGIRRPPPPPAGPPSNGARPSNPRGGRDAPETAAAHTNVPVPDLFVDAEYSSDESEADHLDLRGGKSREPPASCSNDRTKQMAAQPAMSRIDPPDEPIQQMNRYNGPNSARGKSPKATNTSSSRGVDRSQTGRNQIAQGNHRDNKHSSMLLQEEEELLYEQYQDQLFRQQPVQFQQQPQQQQLQQQQQLYQPLSSHYGQFNIAPAVEMTTLNGNGTNKKQSKKKHKNHSVQESKNRGRYNTAQLLLNPTEEVDVENTIDRVLDTIPITENGQISRHKTHEEFYNLENIESSDDESSDDDEERPLRGRSNNTDTPIPRSATSFASAIEHCYNKTIVVLIVLLSVLYVRDHTPRYKRHQSQLAEERYRKSHVPDPMKVYNSADDDSTRARDHDPTNVYRKKKKKKVDDTDKDEKNVYNQVSAGERISDRPAKKR